MNTQNTTKETIYDLLIVGGGPSALSAAIYGSRAGLKTIVISAGPFGGKVNNTHSVENYLGIDKVSGSDLAQKFHNHAKSYGAELVYGTIIGIENINDKIKTILLESKASIKTKTIILTVGMLPVPLPIDSYDRLLGKGISTCIVCDGAFHRGNEIAVIGGGNSAAEESIYIAEIVKKIYIINKFPSFKAEDITIKKLSSIKNIEILHNYDVEDVLGEDKVESILIKDMKTGKTKSIKVSGVFTYIGWKSNIGYLSNLGITDEYGMLLVNLLTMETKIPGLYGAGDIIAGRPYKQIVIAASDGAVAALSAKQYIDNQ